MSRWSNADKRQGRRLNGVPIQISQYDPSRAFLGEAIRQRLADAARRASDDDDLIANLHGNALSGVRAQRSE
jgi:hypothetical protein